MKTEKAEEFFKELLKKHGFDKKKPDLLTGWTVFKKMSAQPFDCAGDSLLFETGVYDFTGEALYYISLVRQFTIDVDGEYDYLEQLHLEFTYQPEECLKDQKTIIQTYDFDDDFQMFFEAVEKAEAFLLPQEMIPAGVEIYMDEV